MASRFLWVMIIYIIGVKKFIFRLAMLLLLPIATVVYVSCSKGTACVCKNQLTHEVREVHIAGGECSDLETESRGVVIEDCEEQ